MEIESHENKYLQAAERALVLVGEAVKPGAFLVDIFPICLYLNSIPTTPD